VSGRIELLRLLADGALHSGEELAAKLSISRAAVWKRLQQFEEWGIGLESRPEAVTSSSRHWISSTRPQFGRSCRLPPRRNSACSNCTMRSNRRAIACSPLKTCRRDALTPALRNSRVRVAVGAAGAGSAPFGSGLCLSVSWSYRDAPATLGALSLAAGVAALRALSRLGFAGLALKWPNDIVHEGAKLGGILIDLRGEAAGPAFVVVGIGINVRLPQRGEVRRFAPKA
jgi:BirA family biotin operon repressor/biotin-[acetyl-CoA-carboxylase] ligase